MTDQFTLTTLRIIQKNKEGSKEMNLKDYVSFEIIQKKSRYCLIISILFAGIEILTSLLSNSHL